MSKSIRGAHSGSDWEYLYHARVFGDGRICPTRCWADPNGGDPICAEEIYTRSANYNSTRAYAPGCDAGDKVMSIEADAMRNWENLIGNLNKVEAPSNAGPVAPTTNVNMPANNTPQATRAPASLPALPALPAAPGAKDAKANAERYLSTHDDVGREGFYIGDRPANRMSPAGEACGINMPISEERENPFRNHITHCHNGLYASSNADVQVPRRDHQTCSNLALQSAFPGARLADLSDDERDHYLPNYTTTLCSARYQNGCLCDLQSQYPDADQGLRMMK